MAFFARSQLRVSIGLVAFVLAALTSGCQKEDHPPYAAGCVSDCKPGAGISIGSGTPSGGGSGSVVTDAGFNAGTLTGSVVLLNDETFTRAAAFNQAASIEGDAASGGVVSGQWDGTNPYTVTGLTVEDTNWVTVTPGNAQGDALPTIQAVQTDATDTADLAVVDATTLDSVLTAVASTRAPALGQVILFFRNAGTGAAVSGIQATMTTSEAPAYAATNGWAIQDDTTVTNASGLVVFGNVTVPVGSATTQTVSVVRPATATTAAANGGTFAVRVVEGTVTVASIGVKL